MPELFDLASPTMETVSNGDVFHALCVNHWSAKPNYGMVNLRYI